MSTARDMNEKQTPSCSGSRTVAKTNYGTMSASIKATAENIPRPVPQVYVDNGLQKVAETARIAHQKLSAGFGQQQKRCHGLATVVADIKRRFPSDLGAPTAYMVNSVQSLEIYSRIAMDGAQLALDIAGELCEYLVERVWLPERRLRQPEDWQHFSTRVAAYNNEVGAPAGDFLLIPRPSLLSLLNQLVQTVGRLLNQLPIEINMSYLTTVAEIFKTTFLAIYEAVFLTDNAVDGISHYLEDSAVKNTMAWPKSAIVIGGLRRRLHKCESRWFLDEDNQMGFYGDLLGTYLRGNVVHF